MPGMTGAFDIIVTDPNSYIIDDYDLVFNVSGEVELEKIKKQMNKNPISISKYSHNLAISSENYVLDEINKYFQKIKKLQFGLPDNQIQIKNGLLREFSRVFSNLSLFFRFLRLVFGFW